MAAPDNKSLGRLKRINLREVWKNEAGDFTPWLAQSENIKLLAETIGVDLELEAQEKEVGPFRADVLCKDTASGDWVIIENQLERTDHVHLGQLLTYAAGLKAVTIVWIASKFNEEHRAAIDWLNEITNDQFNFFGLEIELWRIGDSPYAPKFNIVASPNEWGRTINTTLSETKLLQQEFWTTFRSYVQEEGSFIKPTKPLPQHWMNISLGRSGFKLTAIASMWDSLSESYENNEIRAEFEIYSPDSKKYFSELFAQKEEIDSEIGEKLTWYNPPKARVCRIYLRESANLRDKENWPNLHKWLLNKLELLYKVFFPRIRNL
jgi:hypothetical protein